MSRLPGKFVWFEIHAKDIDAARAFYGEVCGLRSGTMPMGDGSDYAMLKVGDRGVAGVVKLQGPTAHWLGYVSVEDVDATAASVKKAGGQILAEAFDVAGIGRISIAADNRGGVLGLFKAESDDPADEPAQSGDFHWMELWTDDVEASQKFYQDVFGYEVETMAMPQGDYVMLKSQGVARAGLMQKPDSSVPTMWLPYIQSDDVDALVTRARKHGADIKMEPQDTPGVGRHGLFMDAAGAAIGVITPAASAN